MQSSQHTQSSLVTSTSPLDVMEEAACAVFSIIQARTQFHEHLAKALTPSKTTPQKAESISNILLYQINRSCYYDTFTRE